jgi:hypothetical protein
MLVAAFAGAFVGGQVLFYVGRGDGRQSIGKRSRRSPHPAGRTAKGKGKGIGNEHHRLSQVSGADPMQDLTVEAMPTNYTRLTAAVQS